MRKNLGRWIGIIISAILVSNCGMNVQAAPENKPATAGEEQKEQTPENKREQELKRAYNKTIETNGISGWPQGPQIYGESAIVMDMQSGAVLYGKGIDEKRYPASITKILTALVALDNCELTDKVVFSREAIGCLEPGYSHLSMKPDEEITMKDALCGLMLASANEVAYAIAENVGGTHENFINMMNNKAKELGCTGTHFINASGMFSEEHYTTARDMALISRAAFQNPDLLEIIQTKQYTIPPTNKEKESRTFQQHHKMRIQGEFFDERCIGGKTGYTDEASNTLVTLMEEDGRKVISVVMKAKKDIYPGTKAICDYAFEKFEEVNISQNEKSEKYRNMDSEAYVTLPVGMSFDDLTSKMDDKGNIDYFYGKHFVGSGKLVLKENAKMKIKGNDKKSSKSNIKWVIGCVVIAIILTAAALIHILLESKRNQSMRRRRKQKVMRSKKRRRKKKDDFLDYLD